MIPNQGHLFYLRLYASVLIPQVVELQWYQRGFTNARRAALTDHGQVCAKRLKYAIGPDIGSF
jgi:hypothetical protein